MNNLKNIFKHIFFLLALSVITILFRGAAAQAANFQTIVEGSASSTNVNRHDYAGYASRTPISYLHHDAEGGYTRVEYVGEYCFVVEHWSEDFAVTYRNTVKMEYEYSDFGGAYINDDYIYIATGGHMVNCKAPDGNPEIVITQYDKDGNRIKGLYLPGTNSYMPFYFGGCAFAEMDGAVYIRASHLMYMSYDGFNHQASMMFKFDRESMALLSSQVYPANVRSGYVSHSFNQLLAIRDGVLYACDHGDARDRGVDVLRFNTERVDSGVTPATPFQFDGDPGDNYTGAMLGGFAVSSTHTLSAGTSKKQVDLEDQNAGLGVYEDGRVKNIFVATTSHADFSSDYSVNWITDYDPDANVTASNPYLVDLHDGTYMLIWEVCEVNDEYTGTPVGELAYVRIDHAGHAIESIRTIQGALSDCIPIVAGDNIVWYVTDRSSPIVYQLPKDGDIRFDDLVVTQGEYVRHLDNFDACDGVFRCYVDSDGTNCAELVKVESRTDNIVSMIDIPRYVSINGIRYEVARIKKSAIKGFDRLSEITFLKLSENLRRDVLRTVRSYAVSQTIHQFRSLSRPDTRSMTIQMTAPQGSCSGMWSLM